MSDIIRTIVSRSNNSLLAKVPDSEWEVVRPHLTSVELAAHQILYGRNQSLEHVYFPRCGCIALMVDFADGFQAEVGLVGAEGMVGVPLVSGSDTDIVAAVVLAPGEAMRIPAATFMRSLAQMPSFGRLLLRYGDGLREQAMQLAGCNGHHSLDARLARCLLTMQDRLHTKELRVTHEGLAALLSAHRPSISVTAKRLQQAGVIQYSVGMLTIVDRERLEQASCECYGVIQDRVRTVMEVESPWR